MNNSKITDYTVVRHTILFDACFTTTFQQEVQNLINCGWQPYGKPLLVPEQVTGFTEPRIVGYQTLVKYAPGPKPLPHGT